MDVMAAMYGVYKKKLTLDVSVPDIEKQIRDVFNKAASPLGVIRKEPKVIESIIPSAHKKSEPTTKDRGLLTALPVAKIPFTAPATIIHPSFAEPIPKIPYKAPAPIAKIKTPVPKTRISFTAPATGGQLTALPPGLRVTKIIPEIKKSLDDRTKPERILNVIKTDVADQIRNTFNATTSPKGITKIEPKVNESIMPSAHKKSEPATKVHPSFPEPVPVAKIPFTAPAPVAKIATPDPAPDQLVQLSDKKVIEVVPKTEFVSKIAVAKNTPDIEVNTADKPASKITMETEPVNDYTLHPGLEDSEVMRIVEEGGARAERVLRVVTTGKADVPVKTLSTTALLLIGVALYFLLK